MLMANTNSGWRASNLCTVCAILLGCSSDQPTNASLSEADINFSGDLVRDVDKWFFAGGSSRNLYAPERFGRVVGPPGAGKFRRLQVYRSASLGPETLYPRGIDFSLDFVLSSGIGVRVGGSSRMLQDFEVAAIELAPEALSITSSDRRSIAAVLGEDFDVAELVARTQSRGGCLYQSKRDGHVTQRTLALIVTDRQSGKLSDQALSCYVGGIYFHLGAIGLGDGNLPMLIIRAPLGSGLEHIAEIDDRLARLLRLIHGPVAGEPDEGFAPGESRERVLAKFSQLPIRN